MFILGISAFRDDASVALLCDGAVVGIAEEERFLRVKHAVELPVGPFITSLGEAEEFEDFELRYFPERGIQWLTHEAGIDYGDIDYIAYDFDHTLRATYWERFEPYASVLDSGRRAAMESMWRYWRRRLEELAARCGAELVCIPHHQAHAAGTVFGSGFSETNFLIMDALGELESTTYGHFDGEFRFAGRVALPHSLGLLYAAVTRYLGFRPYSDEQKTMGLAAYGDPKACQAVFDGVAWPTAHGFETDVSAIWTRDVKMGIDNPPRLGDLLGAPARAGDVDPLQPPYPDVAASAQFVLERIVDHLLDLVHAAHPSRRLCMAGGVALNSKANGTVVRRGDVAELFVQPQAGDNGTALGAAYRLHHRLTGARPEPLRHAYWGPGFSRTEVKSLLDRLKLPYQESDDPAADAARMLADGRIVGWFQGRSECGPRALGNRSILANPADPSSRARVNATVKEREEWRPFAASILDEDRADYLAIDVPSEFMLLTVPLTARGLRQLRAAAHVDGTTRPQTVRAAVNSRYHRLISRFREMTGIGAVLNTSLNVRSEPIANEPLDAIRNLYGTALDALVIDDFVLAKEPLPELVGGPARQLVHEA